jgi:hypothetical protein
MMVRSASAEGAHVAFCFLKHRSPSEARMVTAMVRLSGWCGELVDRVLASPRAASAFCAAVMVALTWSRGALMAMAPTSGIEVASMAAVSAALRSERTDITVLSLSLVWYFYISTGSLISLPLPPYRYTGRYTRSNFVERSSHDPLSQEAKQQRPFYREVGFTWARNTSVVECKGDPVDFSVWPQPHEQLQWSMFSRGRNGPTG